MGTHLRAANASGRPVEQHKLKVSNARCNISSKHSFYKKSVHCRSWFTMGKPGLNGSKGYEEKREKNNEAVRKSREKKREKEKLTKAELERVREENRSMEEQIHRLES